MRGVQVWCFEAGADAVSADAVGVVLAVLGNGERGVQRLYASSGACLGWGGVLPPPLTN